MTAPQQDSGRSGTMSRPPPCGLLNLSPTSVTNIYLLRTFVDLVPALAAGKAAEVRGPKPRVLSGQQHVGASPPAGTCLGYLLGTPQAVALLTQFCCWAPWPVGCKP